jgi:DNA-binding LacI/PurR family transcriptional regulator
VVTIIDVARQAGVSVTTVSKVLNNYSDVSSKTRIKVNEAIQKLKYQPNVMARGLVKGRSWTVGLFLCDLLTNPFVSELVEGIRKSLGDHGYDLMHLSTQHENPEYSFVKHCLSRHVDGVIVFAVGRSDPSLNELIKAEIPTMFVDIDLLGRRAGYITADHRNGILLGFEHLYRLGHRRISFVTGDLGGFVGQSRFEGYQQALRTYSIPYMTKYVEVEDYSEEGGYRAMQRFMDLLNRPTGVICTSDRAAIGVIRTVQDHGLRVPDDVSVIGFDNTVYAQLFSPNLTTINQNIFTMGTSAAEHLIAMIENPDYSPPVVIDPVELITRESTAPPRG